MSKPSHIQRVAIVGAGGRIGSHFTDELLKTSKHTITVLTRQSSKTTFAQGVIVKPVDFDNEKELTAALRGQQFLVITLSPRTPTGLHSKLVKAALKAGVAYIMPNAYGFDFTNAALCRDESFTASCAKKCEEIEQLGGRYIAMVCGAWYDWCLPFGEAAFGFDIKERKVTFFDDGLTKINISTWQNCGRALAALLSLPQEAGRPCLADWANKPLYVASFRISQRDMLDSLNRVLETTDAGWSITYESTPKRITDGNEAVRTGDMFGMAKAMYSRFFFPNGDADYESVRGLANNVLRLPVESLDEATRRALERVDAPFA